MAERDGVAIRLASIADFRVETGPSEIHRLGNRRAAIVNEDGRSFVYVVEADAAVRREIDYVDWPAARLIVTQGLAPDDVVITTPAEVSEGAPVRPESP